MRTPYIKQGDYSRWAGCYVQVPGMPPKLFSYSRHGRREAKRLATAYRDSLLSQMPGSNGANWIKRKPQSNSSTGILGVYIQGKGRNRKIIAHCIGERRRTFAVKKYGLEKALRLAKRARRQMVLAKLEG